MQLKSIPAHFFGLVFSLVAVLLLACAFSPRADDTIPAALKPWIPWVLNDHQALKCPFINQTDYADQQNHLCVWPGTLGLAANSDGGTFNQSWQVISPGWIPLPGGRHHWPQQVRVNDKAALVSNHRQQPAVYLAAGNYHISGQFDWDQLPERLNIPDNYAIIDLSVNGRSIAFAKRDKNELWLGQPRTGDTTINRNSNSTRLTVSRKIEDGPYLKLETRIRLHVAGRLREEILGKVLPPGFKPVGLQGDLAAFLDADGNLRAKLRPGNWQLTVYAWADPMLLQWQRPERMSPWPQQEIWVFSADEALRSGKLSGVGIIDPGLANLPPQWTDLPAYVVNPGDRLNYRISHRGKPLQLENRLHLERRLWLSFDRTQYAFNDHLSGEMINHWRLNMPSPFRLGSAEDPDGPILISSLKADRSGIENRYPKVDINARGVIERQSPLPVTGWDSHFESVTLTLNLPPASRLFSVFGADSVSRSWWSNWSIWACFVVLFSALLAARVVGTGAGILTAITLILIYQENSAPIVPVVNLLLATAVATHQPFPRLAPLVRGYFALSLFAAVAAVLFFSATELRNILHPQLEARHSDHLRLADTTPGIRHRGYSPMTDEAVSAAPEIQQQEPGSGPGPTMAGQARNSFEAVASFARKVKPVRQQRYQADTVIQTGAGIPDWQWQQYRIQWNSPVAGGQTFSLLILSGSLWVLFKLAAALFALLWLYSVAKTSARKLLFTAAKAPPVTGPDAATAVAPLALASLLLLAPTVIPSAQADELPDQALLQALTQRLIEPPPCNPRCATINRLTLNATATRLNLTLHVHAHSSSAIALPQSEFWQPQRVLLNGEPQTRLYRHQGWIVFPVDKGISRLDISGVIAPVESFQLRFKELPQWIGHNGNDAWEIVGSRHHKLNSNTLAFNTTARPKTAADDGNSQHRPAVVSRYPVTPFVRVTRVLSIDQPWTVATTVTRIAPDSGSISVNIPLLPGEQVNSQGIIVDNQQVKVTIGTGKQSQGWHSVLEHRSPLTIPAPLAAGDDHKPLAARRMEEWQVISSPAWHVEFSGIPLILQSQANDDYFRYHFYPQNNEHLTLMIDRPVAVKGQTLAIDRVRSQLDQGKRTSVITLSFDYRSTRGGEHTITLPVDHQLKAVSSDGRILNLQPEGLNLTLPIAPGKHSIELKLRAEQGDRLLLSGPDINLNAPLGNIESQINLNSERWVLWTNGPVLGPAVVYWGELLVFILIALILSKYPFSPLTTVGWLMLGIGLSLGNWAVLILVAVWFASLTASKYRAIDGNRWWFNLSQLLLYGLSLITLITLISTIPMSLLGTPDMGITGNGSLANRLRWFTDQSEGNLPELSVLSIPTLVYRGIMLLWVLWLSFSLLGWIKWAWNILAQQGHWRSKAVNQTNQV